METFIAFTKSPMGEIIIRVICVLFIGAIGLKLFIKKVADIFELFAKGKRKQAIELLSDVFSYIGTVGISILVSQVYAHIGNSTMKEIYINAEGIFYGFGAIGVAWCFEKDRFMKFWRALRGKKK